MRVLLGGFNISVTHEKSGLVNPDLINQPRPEGMT
jgi:hypothetical protein